MNQSMNKYINMQEKKDQTIFTFLLTDVQNAD